ncbi:hypothetical protein D3C87_1734420 [compost metagenome]
MVTVPVPSMLMFFHTLDEPLDASPLKRTDMICTPPEAVFCGCPVFSISSAGLSGVVCFLQLYCITAAQASARVTDLIVFIKLYLVNNN